MTRQTISRAAIVKEACSWILPTTLFHHQASVKGVGCDCIGLIVGVAAACGIDEAAAIRADPRYRGYGRLPKGNDLRDGCAEFADPIAIADAREGDVLLLTFLREPMHVAILSRVNPHYIIHAYQPIGRVVENGLDEKWRRRIISAHRFRGVEP